MKNTSGNITDSFLEDIYYGGVAWSTMEAYRKDLKYFVKWYEKANDRRFHLGEITGIDLRECQATCLTCTGLNQLRLTDA